MNVVLRHAMIGIVFSVLLSLIMMGFTFLTFPPEEWSVLMERDVWDMPFLLFALIIPVMIGAITGISVGLYWHKRLHRIDRQLDELVKGQKVTIYDAPEKEFIQIQTNIRQLREKLNKQTELKQRQATERAHERERTLQEVVIQERNRLARELHDSVSQQLFAASMMMSAINESTPPEDHAIQQQLTMVEKMINQSQLEMRALLLHLRPVALKGKSLIDGINELLGELTQKVPIEVEWKVETLHLDKGIEDHLFRILQESISNTLRHAKALTIHVMLIERDNIVILRVVDDGVGFDMEKTHTSSYGLQNMKERAHEVGGTFKIVSLPNQGTQLEVKVPRLRYEDDGND
ncbi:sensor histidine kinase [Virgibacillus alimentarius]|uniref:Sensor histidine kinase n=1 Tax=Virgibacillus alimentarius TaxID=698769 RepID=A0ABS4S916_9BACI|nr:MULTISPECIES: sensor histidine kinase [Virgibacillus]MBP2257904.1 NarL family two-component system sensor histidine kinase LiaS [Virgibacillus alimentarius]HLR69481.1 sensor histidine kinase [Virgibacillus sp.]